MRLSLLLLTFFFKSLALGRVVMPRDPLRQYEKAFSEAVLQFHERNFELALQNVNEILKKHQSRKAIELRGLIQKSAGRYEDSRKTYLYLLKKIRDDGIAPAEGAGAQFDLGVIEFNFKNYPQSLAYFEFCIANNFNKGASYFFRGLINYKSEQFESAMTDLNLVLTSDAHSLKALAAMYLSDIHSKNQRYEEAINYLARAFVFSKEKNTGEYELSEELQKNQTEIREKITANLIQLNTPQYFRYVALFANYDSNVLSVPVSGTVADIFSGKASNKLTIKGLFGHATGHFADLQKVWSYQFSGNINQNRETETGQFLTNDFIYLWNKKPYSDELRSFRLGLNSNFQYQVNPETEKGAFGPYSLALTTGYLLRNRLDEKNANAFDFSLRYENFLQDPAFSSFMKKTGFELSASYLRSWDSKKIFFNPALGGGLRGRYSDGSEFRHVGLQLTAANQFYFSPKHLASLTLTYASTSYSERLGEKRKDVISTAQWDQSYQVSSSLSLLLSLNHTFNDSNIADVYKYNRSLISAGASYSF